jgi:antitoxin ParD1/3/4
MSNVAKVSVALTLELNDMVQQAVASGDYASSSEVIREALRDWKAKRSLLEDRADLRALWNEGIASGPGRFGSINEIKAEARRRMSMREEAKGR